MLAYNLGFISNEDLFNHVFNTVNHYRKKIDFKEFYKNILDPIKMTFDSIIYKRDIEAVIQEEVFRQMDKSNANHIGYFHQNIFRYIGGNEWVVPREGFDLVNTNKNIFVEIKNKHNTMNASSSQKTYMRMQHAIQQNNEATCYLMEIIAKHSQNDSWVISLDKEQIKNDRIRRISVDRFYALVTGKSDAFYQLCKILPIVIKDVVGSLDKSVIENTVMNDLYTLMKKDNKSDYLELFYYLSFKEYEGFK